MIAAMGLRKFSLRWLSHSLGDYQLHSVVSQTECQIFSVKSETVGDQRRVAMLDQMKTVGNARISRTACELTGTKSARRLRTA